VPDYATVQGILIGVVATFVIFITITGPENHGSQFEAHKPAFEDGSVANDASASESPMWEKRVSNSDNASMRERGKENA
jgi:SHS family lactate transporter-like MFS transporter